MAIAATLAMIKPDHTLQTLLRLQTLLLLQRSALDSSELISTWPNTTLALPLDFSATNKTLGCKHKTKGFPNSQ